MALSHLHDLAPDIPPELESEQLDGLDLAVLAAHQRHDRSAVLCSLMSEFYGSIAWLNRSDPADGELRSLRLVLDAAEAHHERQCRHDNSSPCQLPFDLAAW